MPETPPVQHLAQHPAQKPTSYSTLLERRKAKRAWEEAIRPRLRSLREAGLSQIEIAHQLNLDGFRTFEGRLIDQPRVSRLLAGSPYNNINGGS